MPKLLLLYFVFQLTPSFSQQWNVGLQSAFFLNEKTSLFSSKNKQYFQLMQEFRPEHAYFNVRLNEGIFIADNKTLPMISGNFGAIIGKQLMLMPSLGYYVVPKQSWGSLIEAELAYQYKKMTPFIKYSFLRKHYKNTYYDHFGGKETYVDITSEFWLLFGLKYQINKPHKTVATMR